MPRATAAAIESLAEAAELEGAIRRANARQLLETIADVGAGVAPIQVYADAVPGFLRLPVRCRRGLAGFPSPPEAIRLGIAPSYPSTLAALPKVRAALAADGSWPGAEALARELCTLPTHSLVTLADRERLATQVGRYGHPR
jgi:hypothetical protein